MLLVLALVVIGGAYWYYVSRRPPSGRAPGGMEYRYKNGEGSKTGMQFPILGKPKPPELPKTNGE